MHHITIKDVAKKLGVAPSTISRAFNNATDIKQETKERILRVAKEMGYHPNPIAKRLYTQRSYQVGVVVPEFENDFFPHIIMGMQRVFVEKGYQLLIMQSDESYEHELENVKKLEENMVEGLLISLTSESTNIEYYNSLFERDLPMVFFNRVNEKIKAPKVVFNDFKWSYFAVEHLIKQGCKNIYHLAGYKHLSLSRERMRGYEKAMNKFHLDYSDEHIFEAGFSKEGGERAMSQLLEQGHKPDAIFAANDPTAVGALRALRKHGIKVPEEVAVIGFSAASWSDMISPPLSTVEQPTEQIGETSAHLLLQQIDNKPLDQKIIELEGKLRIRESSLRGG